MMKLKKNTQIKKTYNIKKIAIKRMSIKYKKKKKMKGEIEKKNSKTILNNKKYINQKNKSQI